MKGIVLALCLALAGTQGAGAACWNKEPRLEIPVAAEEFPVRRFLLPAQF